MKTGYVVESLELVRKSRREAALVGAAAPALPRACRYESARGSCERGVGPENQGKRSNVLVGALRRFPMTNEITHFSDRAAAYAHFDELQAQSAE